MLLLKKRSLCIALIALVFAATAARADHHSWRFAELFSVPDGSVQFIEMRATANGEDQLAGEAITSGANTFVFPNNLPNPGTANARLLLATPAFAALPGAPTPDYTIPAGFLGAPGETLSYGGSIDVLSMPALADDGMTSWNRGAPPNEQPNSPSNFAGATGSIYVPFCGNGAVDAGEACDAGAGGSTCCSSTCTAASSGLACSDGNLCTLIDACDGLGTCVGSSALDCDDGNSCTIDTCSPALGCESNPEPDTTLCDDENLCTQTSVCQAGICVGSDPLTCDDGNICTQNACDPAIGCVFPDENFVACDDGSACTVGDVCFGGACVAGAPANCADGNGCTDDLCDPILGCQNPPNTASCDDGDFCTVGDVCAGGACQSGGGQLDCYDGNDCTSDACLPSLGCNSSPLADATPCDDANVCTQQSACSAGQCIGSNPITCSDGNPCTMDACDAVAGCVFPDADFEPCDDGSVCTTNDVCLGGACEGGSPLNCGDGNECTDDLCDPALGCSNPNNTLPCTDGSTCTLGDTCSNGVCLSGTGILDCDDGDPCTAESCDAIAGCSNTPIPGCVSPPDVPTSSLASRTLLLALLVLCGGGLALRREVTENR